MRAFRCRGLSIAAFIYWFLLHHFVLCLFSNTNSAKRANRRNGFYWVFSANFLAGDREVAQAGGNLFSSTDNLLTTQSGQT
jgi:hypothetical protein